MKNKPIKFAMPLLGRGVWTGGYIYLKNTLSLVSSRMPDRLETHVFLSNEENEKYGRDLSGLVTGKIISDPAIAIAGRGRSLLRALTTGRDQQLENILRANDIHAVFETASFYGSQFAIPAVSWIPDLQHRYMPKMFGPMNWWRRDLGFRMQVHAGRKIMLSSFTAQSDLERFYPKAKGNTHVVRFAIDLDIGKYLRMANEIRNIYNLPTRFFFLPNQFWLHKNHKAIVEALILIKNRGELDNMPPIVLTGQAKDPRNPDHFESLMAAVTAGQVGSHFRYLGLVPYDHVLALNATSERMINPSLFEGWSTPIEEAKAFATPLILSDIPIHKEQAPQALFFDPNNIESAADALLTAARERPLPRPELSVIVSEQNVRLQSHADSLLYVVQKAVASQH
jgi:glycosyltransferase involved in cell wall biosynthesis